MGEAMVTKKCKTCKKEFSYSSAQAQWLLDRNLADFPHCPACRQIRKVKKHG
jgi:hypothetical protein